MSDESTDYLRQIAEATDLLVKLALQDWRGERTQKEVILYLDEAGVSAGRIADLLGTTTQTVYPTLSRARKRREKA